MNNKPDTELDLDFDLNKLFLPAWAQEPRARDRFAKYEGEEESQKQPGRKAKQLRKRAPLPKKQAPRLAEQKLVKPKPPEAQQRPEPTPLPEVDVAFEPEEKCVESIVRQIKTTGRAYPLFEIAKLVLKRADLHTVTFKARKSPEGQLLQPLVVSALDDTLWTSEDEAAAYILETQFDTFYQTERVPTDPPKGKYTFVAQCGLSGVILGPPNHHDYQTKLVRLHQERFPHMPFEVFKSHVKIVRDEAVVKKWIEEQSWKTQYVCLNVPEPLRLESRQDVEAHFRMVHLPNLIKQVDSYTISGAAARKLKCKGLRRAFHRAYEHQRRFPLQMATALSQQFAARGLQFFKVNRTITHVSVARPHYLDLETTPVSESVRRIIQFINAHPKCTRRQLIGALAPSPAEARKGAPTAEQPSATEPNQPINMPEHTPEQLAVIADLHWLVHQGHVIEFADGTLDTAKKPAPRPPKQKPRPESALAEQPQAQQEQLEPVAESQGEELAQVEAAEPALEHVSQPESASTAQIAPDISGEPEPIVESGPTESDAEVEQPEPAKEIHSNTESEPQNTAALADEEAPQPAEQNKEQEKTTTAEESLDTPSAGPAQP